MLGVCVDGLSESMVVQIYFALTHMLFIMCLNRVFCFVCVCMCVCMSVRVNEKVPGERRVYRVGGP